MRKQTRETGKVIPNPDYAVDPNPDNHTDRNPDDTIDVNHSDCPDYIDCKRPTNGYVYLWAGQIQN